MSKLWIGCPNLGYTYLIRENIIDNCYEKTKILKNNEKLYKQSVNLSAL